MVTHGDKSGFLLAIITQLLNTIPTKREKSGKMVQDKIKILKQKWQSTKNTMTNSNGRKAKRYGNGSGIVIECFRRASVRT